MTAPPNEPLSQFRQRLEKVKAQLSENLDAGLNLAALALQAEAQKRCPVDTGALRASAYTRRSGSGDLIEYRVGFSQHYAVYVHEMTNANFKVGQAKFLEEPFMILRNDLLNMIRVSIQSNAVQGPSLPVQGPSLPPGGE